MSSSANISSTAAIVVATSARRDAASGSLSYPVSVSAGDPVGATSVRRSGGAGMTGFTPPVTPSGVSNGSSGGNVANRFVLNASMAACKSNLGARTMPARGKEAQICEQRAEEKLKCETGEYQRKEQTCC